MKTLSNAAIARHWQVTRSYVSVLANREDLPTRPRMPRFADPGEDAPDRWKEADEWRQRWAPARPGNLARRGATAPEPPVSDASDGPSFGNERGGGVPLELDPVADFPAWILRKAEQATQRAYLLYENACIAGKSHEIANALKNATAAADHAEKTRKKWLDIQERESSTLGVLEAVGLVGRYLDALRTRLEGMGGRLGPDLNPADPTVAASIVDAEIDRIFLQMESVCAELEEHDPEATKEVEAA